MYRAINTYEEDRSISIITGREACIISSIIVEPEFFCMVFAQGSGFRVIDF